MFVPSSLLSRRHLTVIVSGLLLLTACQQAPSPTTGITSPTPQKNLGLYELNVNSSLKQATVTRTDTPSSGIHAQIAEIQGLSFKPTSLTIVRDVTNKVIHMTAAFEVTNNSGSNLTLPTYMPAVVRGTNGTVANTPFKQVKTTSGADASGRVNDMKVEVGQQANPTTGVIEPIPGITPIVENLNSANIQATVGNGQTLYDIAPFGWRGTALANGAKQMISFAVKVPMGATASTQSQPDDVYSFSLVFAAVDQPVQDYMQSMTPPELEMVKYINEIRTKGTINGDSTVRAGTCIAGFVAGVSNVPALGTWSNAAIRAAHKHTNYQAFEGNLNHNEPLINSLWFYGATFGDRITRVLSDYPFARITTAGENVGYQSSTTSSYSDVAQMTLKFLQSNDHCLNMMNPSFKAVGVGYRAMPDPDPTYGTRGTWTQVFNDEPMPSPM